MTVLPTTTRCALPGSPLAAEASGLDACVHCGFCLPACPTYLALDDENDSPRGRLVLMKALLEGTLDPTDPTLTEPIGRCLGCRGCETACPSGVPYGQLLEATRATIAQHQPLDWRARLVLAVFAREGLLRLALGVARVARDLGIIALAARLLRRTGLGFPLAMLASTRRAERTSWSPATAERPRGLVTLLTGCVMEGLFTEVNRATERVLTVNGWALCETRGQRCCGALHAHAGDRETARALARANIAAFEATDEATIVLNSAGCGAMCRSYGHLLGDDPAWAARAERFSARVRDVSEVLVETGPIAVPVLGYAAVAYDAPCHLQHGQRVVSPPLAVLDAMKGLDRRPLEDSDQCCGSAGIYNLIEPEVADRVLAPKLLRIRESGARVLATGNPGCLMQIGAGLLREHPECVARHPVELLDHAYAAAKASR